MKAKELDNANKKWFGLALHQHIEGVRMLAGCVCRQVKIMPTNMNYNSEQMEW